ncbi:patatin-like phospholipase family protein [Nanoarchaeota archaeon]
MEPKKSRYKTALVLGGGGSRGAFEIGVLKVLTKKIIPDIIIGTSVGAMNGALYSLGMTPEQMEKAVQGVTTKMMFPFNRKILYKLYSAKSLADPKNLKRFLYKYLGKKRFKDCKIPLYINATKLKDGKGEFFHNGLLIDAVLASSAIPPYYPPHIVKGKAYVDGGLSDYIGTEEALKLNCEQLIIVNLGYHGHPEHYNGLINISSHTINMLTYQSFLKEIELAKEIHKKVIIIESDKEFKFSITDFSHTNELIKAGERIAKRMLRHIIV